MMEPGFKEVESAKMAYDPKKDGVWLFDGGEKMAFIPRHIIIGMVGELGSKTPKEAP